MVGGVRWTGVIMSKTADLLGFSHSTISRIYREWAEKEKIPSEQWVKIPCWCQRSEKNLKNHLLQPWYTNGIQLQKTTLVPLRLAKNRKLRLHFTQTHQNWTLKKCFPGLKSFDFWCDIRMVQSESGINNTKHVSIYLWHDVTKIISEWFLQLCNDFSVLTGLHWPVSVYNTLSCSKWPRAW